MTTEYKGTTAMAEQTSFYFAGTEMTGTHLKACRLSDLTHLELQVYAILLGAKHTGLTRDEIMQRMSFRSGHSAMQYIPRLVNLGLAEAVGKRKASTGYVQTIWKVRT
jgi:predicted transcriptional regulator